MKARITDHSPYRTGEVKKEVPVRLVQRSGPNTCFVELLEEAAGYPKGHLLRIQNTEIVKE